MPEQSTMLMCLLEPAQAEKISWRSVNYSSHLSRLTLKPIDYTLTKDILRLKSKHVSNINVISLLILLAETSFKYAYPTSQTGGKCNIKINNIGSKALM